jgi:hypothetical protein
MRVEFWYLNYEIRIMGFGVLKKYFLLISLLCDFADIDMRPYHIHAILPI